MRGRSDPKCEGGGATSCWGAPSCAGGSGILGGVAPVRFSDGLGILADGKLAGISISGLEEVEKLGSETGEVGVSGGAWLHLLGRMLSRDDDLSISKGFDGTGSLASAFP